jgi:sugar lactone lactonase YvrE
MTIQKTLIASLVLILTALGADEASARSRVSVAPFDAARGELPEGLAVDRRGNAYVGFAATGEIRRISKRGEASTFAQLPSPAPGFMTGLAIDRDENLYVAFASFSAQTHGIWKITPDGQASRHAALDPSGLPNGIAIDRQGILYVTDSFLGRISRVSSDGTVETWKQDVLLSTSAIDALGLPIGANGIALDRRERALYVSNTNEGSILRIAIERDGGAGKAETVTQGPGLVGADGLAFGPDGQLYATVNRQNRIVRIGHGGVRTVAEGGLLQFPASLAVHGQSLYVTSFALLHAFGVESGTPRPALIVIK